MAKPMRKKIFNTVKTVLSIAFFALAAFILINVVVARIKNDVPRIFGYSFHIVKSDSMTPEINVGDIVIAKKTAIADVAEGQDVVYLSQDPRDEGKVIIHRVHVIKPDGSLVTTGIKEGATPNFAYPVKEIYGAYVAKSAFLGKVYTFFSKIENVIFAVVLVVLVYICIKLFAKILKILMQKDVALPPSGGGAISQETTAPSPEIKADGGKEAENEGKD